MMDMKSYSESTAVLGGRVISLSLLSRNDVSLKIESTEEESGTFYTKVFWNNTFFSLGTRVRKNVIL